MKIRNWRKWQYRKYTIAHSRDGFRLGVQERHVFDLLADRGVGLLLKVLGDPCCGEGPLAKIKVSHARLRKLGVTRYRWLEEEYANDDETFDLSEDAMDMVWHDVLQQSCRFYYLNTHVVDIPLTDEQAEKIRPLSNWWFSFDEDDKNACCVTSALLNDPDHPDRDWHSYGCVNFQGHTLL